MDSDELREAYLTAYQEDERLRRRPVKKTVGERIREFHETYGCTIGSEADFNGPEQGMRMKLMREEMRELEDAREDNDFIAYLDALADIVYIAYGNALVCGVDLDDVFDEVHRSNMSKLDADGNPIYRYDGKVLKGPNYSPPDIASILER